MKKILQLVSLLLVISMACALCANPNTFFTNLMNDQFKGKRGLDNICCLPNVFSLKGYFSQLAISQNGSSLEETTGFLSAQADFISGKLRQDFSFTDPNR